MKVGCEKSSILFIIIFACYQVRCFQIERPDRIYQNLGRRSWNVNNDGYYDNRNILAVKKTTTTSSRHYPVLLASPTSSDDEYTEHDGITVSAAIELPFPKDVAFDAFQDPTRQPSWSSWLSSVEYVDPINLPDVTKWTIRIVGLRFSWIAKHTKRDRDSGIIEWQSASGLQNRGRVTFRPLQDDNYDDLQKSHMKIDMTFVTPKIITRLLGGKRKALQRLVEDKMLYQTLEKFSDVVLNHDYKRFQQRQQQEQQQQQTAER
jgi:uncharacterized membrane protein